MKRLVLVGAGHAHAQVLLEWRRRPAPGVELVVVSPVGLAPYSGMVPGWLAGAYRHDEIVIDFPRLCAAAGAHWVDAELDSLDAQRQCVHLSTGAPLEYDLLSLNVGSTLRPPPAAGARVLAMRPLALLPPAYGEVLSAWTSEPGARPWRLTGVGGGPAGVESMLAVMARLRRLRPDRPVHGTLVSDSAQLLPGLSPAARRAASRALAAAGVSLRLGSAWSAQVGEHSDLVLWATGAQAHDWQRDPARRGGLAVQAGGFIRIDEHLRSVSHPQVFASGDCAHWEPAAGGLPKAGVVAVRMGPVLADNLRRAIAGRAPASYRPQPRFLVLLATGDGRAIASRGAFGAEGAWAWRWKNRIDRRFIRRYAVAAERGPAVSRAPTTSLHEGDSA
ncbi:FAD-dependent oxidoreductase [Ramlibacter aurantiacus]|nr:FAD-dependent oxidoreductase [Ramlibacter aurantiacus]